MPFWRYKTAAAELEPPKMALCLVVIVVCWGPMLISRWAFLEGGVGEFVRGSWTRVHPCQGSRDEQVTPVVGDESTTGGNQTNWDGG